VACRSSVPHSEEPQMLRVMSLAVTLAVGLSTPCLAQWPSWADRAFGDRPSWRSEQDPEPWRPPSPQISPTAPLVADGGPRPEFTAVAPETIAFRYDYPVSSIVISTADRKLFYVLPGGQAYVYPISVGREGFSWTGTETISRKQAWPDWYPPKEMRERDSKLPQKMTGGVRNPLGAMALYLGSTLYRIHGTNDVKSIGQAQSSGCFRMMNAAVTHLAGLVDVGTPVTVVSSLPEAPAISQLQQSPRPPADYARRDYRDLRDSVLGARP
jgi:lipoprotein-anchoring transpeptidase ErfK/SrfK